MAIIQMLNVGGVNCKIISKPHRIPGIALWGAVVEHNGERQNAYARSQGGNWSFQTPHDLKFEKDQA